MPEPWGIYCRISRVRREDGKVETLGVDRQQPPCRALVERLDGYVPGDWAVYVDNDLSAYSGHRPEFERMLADLHAGRIRGVAAWAHDRLSRDPDKDNARILELVDQLGCKLATAGGEYDLAAPAGRLHFRIMGSIARHESEHRAERMRLKHDQLAKDGRWHGGPRPFGFAPSGIGHDPAEVELIREAARRLLEGETVGTILRDWTARGVVTPKGKPWVATAFRNMIVSPRQAGLRVHHGEAIGPAAWAPILERATWERVVAVFADRTGRKRLGAGRVYLLSGGIAFCGLEGCGRPLVAGLNKGQSYRCRTEHPHDGCGKISVGKQLLEGEVERRLLRRLAGPKLAELRAQAVAGDQEAERLAVQLRDDEVELVELAKLKGQRRPDGRPYMTVLEWLAAKEPIEVRIEQARRELARRPKLAALADLPTTKAELEAAWARWSVDKRRSVLRAVIRRVEVGPAQPGKRFDPDRVKVDWIR